MRIKKARQIIKCFTDDTRIRIVNLLEKEPLNVTELCEIIGASQSSVSKHLARLRLTGVVSDKRKGFNVYYTLTNPENLNHGKLIRCIIEGLSAVEIKGHDLNKLRQIKKERKKSNIEKKGARNV